MKISKKKIEVINSIKKFPKEISSIILLRVIVGSTLLTYGLRFSTAMKVGILFRVEPLFVLLISFLFLKQKIKITDILMIAVLLFGTFLLSTGGDITTITTSQMGDLLVVLAMLFFAYTYLPGGKLSNSIGALQTNIITNFIGGVILFVAALVLFPVSSFTFSSWAILVFIGYITSFYFIGLNLWYYALKNVRGWIVSYILSIDSLTSALIAYLFLGQILSFIQIVGAIIILVSSIYISTSSK